MQTKKITFLWLSELVDQANSYVRSLGKKKNALSVKIEKITPSLKAALAEYNSKVEDIRTDNCSVDSDGNLIIKEGVKGEDRFSFKPDKLKAIRAAIKAVEKDECDVDVNITANVPAELTYLQSKYFRGIVIPEDYIYPENFEEEKTETLK